MKTRFIFLPLLIFVVLLSACAGHAEVVSEEGFEFTEEEAADALTEEGFDFSDSEALVVDNEQGFVFDEDEGDDPPGMDFDDDEGLNLPDQVEDIFPPAGMTNWLIKHDDGTATCPNQTIPIWGNEPEMVTISLGAEAASLVVSGMEGGPEIFYLLEQSGPGGSLYNGYYQPPGTNAEIHYQILFTNLVDSSMADYLMGSIAAEEQGCKISRSFQGNRVD
jgi:hypothetical protein